VVAEGLSPVQALRIYLESRNVEGKRRDRMMRYAEELISAEAAGKG
jgi:hypothetical protein